MQWPENAADYDGSWSSSSNWSIAAGSLSNSVSFESSLSLIGAVSGESSSPSAAAATNVTAKSWPLVLFPPSPDSASCEITLNFAQKHEVRQVYIRSTARVFEMYYARELHNSNDYLGTVHCGIAARDDEVLRVTDIEEAVLEFQKGSAKGLAGEKLRNGNNLSTNEDDWVEVKVLDSPLSANGSSSSSSKFNANAGRSTQDLYEATAQMADMEPCVSLTIRLVSLQNKGCVCVDELYVFADPVEAGSLGTQGGPAENSAGSLLMSMLVPTLLQSSKSKDVGQAQNNYSNHPIRILEEIAPETADPIISGNQNQQEGNSSAAYQQEVKLQAAVVPSSKPVEEQIPSKLLETLSKLDTSNSHNETLLNQLVCRVSRIEEMMLRFEEIMMKPIISIDDRLQHVEQQLEVLTKKTQTSELLFCPRISAPEFSCSESESNSFYNSGSMDLSFQSREANKKDIISGVSSIPPESAPLSVNTANLHPSLVVTAPEFSNCDEEEENHAVKSVKESPKNKLKKVTSIDDALASALAGFLSSTSGLAQNSSQALAIKAPEFSNEENDNDETPATRVDNERSVDSSTCLSEPDETEHIRISFSSLSVISPMENEENFMSSPNDNNSVKSEGVDAEWQHSKRKGGSQETCADHEVTPTTHDMGKSDSNQIISDIENGKEADKISNVSVLKRTHSLEQFFGNQTDYGSDTDTTQVGTVLNEVNAFTQVTEQSQEHVLLNVDKFQHEASIVDFETPILDVKFVSQEALITMTPLEALLDGMPDLITEVLSVEESANDDFQVGEKDNLISLEDWRDSVSVIDTHITVDMNYCSLSDMPSKSESDELQACNTYRSQEISPTSLI